MQISKASIFTFFTIALLFFSLYSCIKVKEKPDIIPTSVVLTKVEINECKDKYGSNYFDFGSDVDPFIILSDNSFINDLINEENNYKIDVSESQFPVGWDVNVSMPSLSEAYII
ncbi:MAG: hypothetical protein NTX03_08155, partial [Bacteroidetes bacterium]|nr:hypothetical protein [Bacteroidota bacterium]